VGDVTNAAARNRRAIGLGVLGLSAVLALVSQVQLVAAGGDSFRTVDWQINYAGGFVRRGLFGELLLLLTPGGMATLWVLLVVQVACYVPVYALVVGHLARERWSWSAIALACGPLALPFIGWDVNGGFRKEILAFAALALLAGLRRDPARRARWPLAGLALVLWLVAVFSWEPAALMLPAALYLLLARAPGLPGRLPGARALAAAFALVAVVGLALSVATAGDHGQAALVCGSLQASGVPTADPCGGAVATLRDGAAQGMSSVSRAWPGYAGYPALLAAAALPILLSPWLRRHWRWALAAAVATLPLYVIAVDYGRWGHLLFMELLLCLVIGPARDAASRLWNPLAGLLFVGVFGVPNAGPMNENHQWPLGGLLGTVIQIAQLGLYRLTG
jgi:hypothetical protein